MKRASPMPRVKFPGALAWLVLALTCQGAYRLSAAWVDASGTLHDPFVLAPASLVFGVLAVLSALRALLRRGL